MKHVHRAAPHIDLDTLLESFEHAPPLDAANAPVRTRKIADYCDDRNAALNLYPEAEAAWAVYHEAITKANKAARLAAPSQTGVTLGALEFGKLVMEEGGKLGMYENNRRRLDRAVWSHLIEETKFAGLLDAQAKSEFRAGIKDCPPPISEDNCTATFASIYADAEMVQNRGLVNNFVTLNSKDYKSNDCFSIGKRIIIEGVVEAFCGSWSWRYHHYDKRDALIDLERTIDLLEGDQVKDPADSIARHIESKGLKEQAFDNRVFKIRWFLKGTMHVWIKSPEIRAKLNRMIAEHFGAQLGDGTDRPNHNDPFFKSKRKMRSTGVSKVDRNAYYTPPPIADLMAKEARLATFEGGSVSVLDPSCGHGSLLRAAYKAGAATVHGVENHLASANACYDDLMTRFESDGRKTAYFGDTYAKVFCCDFTIWEPSMRDSYTHILMNPPFDFALTHVVKAFRHLRKADTNYKGEVQPAGRLVTVLPTSVMSNPTSDFQTFRDWLKAKNARITQLPANSFRESGTDVDTMIVVIEADIDPSR